MNIIQNTHPPTTTRRDNMSKRPINFMTTSPPSKVQHIVPITPHSMKKLNLTGHIYIARGVMMMMTTMTTVTKTIPSMAMTTTIMATTTMMTRRTRTTAIIYITTSSRQFLAPSAPSVILRLCSETIYSSPHHGILFANISQQTSVTKAISQTSGYDLWSGRYVFQSSDCMNQ